MLVNTTKVFPVAFAGPYRSCLLCFQYFGFGVERIAQDAVTAGWVAGERHQFFASGKVENGASQPVCHQRA